jgi:DNA-binding MarR family transcriptional regulator
VLGSAYRDGLPAVVGPGDGEPLRGPVETGPALNETTYPVLSALARGGRAPAAALAHELGLDRSVVSRRAAQLTEAGLIAPEEDPDDARRVLLVLTDAGLAAVDTMRARLTDAIAAHLADWSASEQLRFARSLRRFASTPLGSTPDEL